MEVNQYELVREEEIKQPPEKKRDCKDVNKQKSINISSIPQVSSDSEPSASSQSAKSSIDPALSKLILRYSSRDFAHKKD